MLRRLEWRVRQAVETMLTGNYRSTFRGRGMEFDQVVKYTWGDDLRDIDWNVTARLGEPYRKKFVEEREVSVLLVFEDSPALQFGSAGRTRRDTLLEMAALLLLLGGINRDRMGVLYASPEGFWFQRPLPGPDYARRCASLLLGQEAPPVNGPSRAEVPWRLALRGTAAHSVLVWLGAFTASPPPDEWTLLCRRFQTLGCRADDPWDFGLPGRTRMNVFDPQAGEVMDLHMGEAEREAHAAWAQRRDAYFGGLFPRASDQLLVSTDAPVFETMVDFFLLNQGREGRGGR